MSKDYKTSLRGRRHFKERLFRSCGVFALCIGVTGLLVLLTSILGQGFDGFKRTYISLELDLNSEILGLDSTRSFNEQLSRIDLLPAVRVGLLNLFPKVASREEKRALFELLSSGTALELNKLIARQPELIGLKVTLPVIGSAKLDQLHKGRIDRSLPPLERGISDQQLAWYQTLVAAERIETRIDWGFFSRGDSRSAETAGIGAALRGSIFALLVCLILSFPIGLATAAYLEEFAMKNRWTELLEVNINNLAAVPSIIYGLLGLAIILNLFGLPRSSPMAGGIVLSLMTLPTIIIASRSALQAVPPSIRHGALAMGASQMQVVLHHVIPASLPGTITGTLIGLSRALGETAPLLMIGMVAFIVEPPGSITDPATVLPVQVYLWAESPERGFTERTSAAIIVILAVLFVINTTAVLLRRRFEQRWS